MHGVHHHPQAAGPQGVQIHQLRQVCEVVGLRIEHLHEPLGLRLGQGQAGHLRRRGNQRLDAAQNLGRGGARILSAHLEAGVLGRVMAGGDDHGPRRLAAQDGVSYHRRRRRAIAEVDWDVVGDQHFSGNRGELLRAETRIVAHHHAAVREPALFDVERCGLGAAAHVVVSELVTDDGPPAVGAEADGRFAHAGASSRTSAAASVRSLKVSIVRQ